MDNQRYWISEKNCVWNVLYHKHHHNDKRNNNIRAGCLYYNGVCIWGNDNDFNLFENIDVRKFHYGCGHFWTECGDDFIIDWVINKTLGIPSTTQMKWDKEKLKELGFVYVPYTKEEAIIKKMKKTFYCSCKEVKKGEKGECGIDWARNYWKRYDL
jgi:hypothetical protein